MHMEWQTQLIIVRPKRDGTLVVLYQSNSFKDSRYWLNYIAELHDALFITPINPKCVDSKDPKYSCHLISRLKSDYNEKAWRNKVFDAGESTQLKFIIDPNSIPIIESDNI